MSAAMNWWPVLAVFSPSLLVLGLIARSVICEVISSLISKGEESDVPEDSYTAQDDDELMAIAEAVADNKDNQHWELWEQEMSGGVPE